MTTEHPSIANEDWRLQAITTLAAEWTSPWSGKTSPVGTPVTAITHAAVGGHSSSIGLPSMTAVMLGFSHKLWAESEVGINDVLLPEADLTKNPVAFDKHTDVFDVLEMRMAAIVFAYTALESFANESIPDGFKFERMRDDRKNLETYTKDQIERNLNLGIKLSEVLPGILKVTSPKGTALWERFKRLEGLRDRIIHLKSVDKKSAGPEEDTIWVQIFSADHPDFAIETKEIIAYYLSATEHKPRWFNKIPF